MLRRLYIDKERGATLVELAVTIFFTSIVVLGLTGTLLAYKNWMDQDLVMHEVLTYGEMCMKEAEDYIVNCQQLSQTGGAGRSFTVYTELDLENQIIVHDNLRSAENEGLKVNNIKMTELFPPKKLRQGEKIEITRFRAVNSSRGNQIPGMSGTLIELNMEIKYSYEKENGTYAMTREFNRLFFAPNVVLSSRQVSQI